MDQATYVKRFLLWVGIIGAIIALVINIIFFKQVEETFFGEVMKRVLMSGLILVVVELFSAVIFGPMCYHFIYERKQKK